MGVTIVMEKGTLLNWHPTRSVGTVKAEVGDVVAIHGEGRRVVKENRFYDSTPRNGDGPRVGDMVMFERSREEAALHQANRWGTVAQTIDASV